MSLPYVKEAGALVLLALLAWAGHGLYRAGYNAANMRAEKVIGEFAKAEAEAQAKAREAEQDASKRVAAIAEQHEQDKRDAQSAADRLAADLRAGNVRLRDEWAGCATDRLSGAAASAAELDAARKLQAESLKRIAAITGEADAKERALQAVVRADREQESP